MPEPQEVVEQHTKEVVLNDDPKNLAAYPDIVEHVKRRLAQKWEAIRSRNDLETIWDQNDKMYRIKLDDPDIETRAETGSDKYHTAIQQLTSLTYNGIVQNLDQYRFEPDDTADSEEVYRATQDSAHAMTSILHLCLRHEETLRQLKNLIFHFYHMGNCVSAVAWIAPAESLVIRGKGGESLQDFDLYQGPMLRDLPLDKVWLDPDVHALDQQEMIVTSGEISWSDLLRKSQGKKKNRRGFCLPKFKKGEGRIYCDRYLVERNDENATPQQDRRDNAGRESPGSDRTGDYRICVNWVNLPIDTRGDRPEWDPDGMEYRFRVTTLGYPDSCDVLEIRPSFYPGGVPMLAAHEISDDLGFYHVSRGEIVKTYYDQICIAQNQLQDMRAKNCRRPILYDQMMVNMRTYDFTHSSSIACRGDPNKSIMELGLLDMTATIMASIEFFEKKIEETMNATDVTMGLPLPGRPSATQYEGSRNAGFAPIYQSMATFESCIISGFMRKFAMYVKGLMPTETRMLLAGLAGARIKDLSTADLAGNLRMVVDGVKTYQNKTEQKRNLMQLYQLTAQDPAAKRDRILEKVISVVMELDRPEDYVNLTVDSDAIKAAKWENHEILDLGEQDEPIQNEAHDVHIKIHDDDLWRAKQNPLANEQNIALMERHIQGHQTLKSSASTSAVGAMQEPLSGNFGSPTAQAPTAGQESGWNLSAQQGSKSLGLPIPMAQ